MDIMNNPIQSFDRSHAPLAVVLPQPRPSLEVLHTLTVIDKLIVLLNFSDVKNTRKYFALVGCDTQAGLCFCTSLAASASRASVVALTFFASRCSHFSDWMEHRLGSGATGHKPDRRSVPSGREGANLTVGKHRGCGEVPQQPQWPTQPTAPRPQSPSVRTKRY